MISIAKALTEAVKQLNAVSDTAVLDAEILLAHVLQVSRSFLHAWPERLVTQSDYDAFKQHIERRLREEPIAYIIGHQEFWSLDLLVTPDTLIPRPETELLVEWVLKRFDSSSRVVADLGTGSGAIALALAKERPSWLIYATDRMPAALAVAKQNAARLHLSSVIFSEGNWCQALPDKQFDAIISNPPYIEEADDQVSKGVRLYEPAVALFSEENGLRDSRQIIQEAKHFLKPGGYLFLEHGYQQGAAIRVLFEQAGYQEVALYQDLANRDRVTIGRAISE
jgi:release factor glutamine methyltransferase